MKHKIIAVFLLLSVAISCQTNNKPKTMSTNLETATLAGGCFWCLEAAYDRLKGVENVQSGFANGHTENPSYKEVCTGETGHAEVVRITYDPSQIDFKTLLEVFWVLHDPTQLNRQGEDIGTQYRSGIFYENEKQKTEAEESMKNSIARGDYDKPYVTIIEPLKAFYPAEDYHTDYFELNQTQPYCSAVIAPKMKKFQAKFKELLKD
ncbi:peptide-methionine (S)-S-oxide reductase MsrA [Ornithobacterium rhinotracheale]|uniref:Peptide methionine sulfoxide reductase MsrA n=1 Tax=Ornithobacterium rhinotracheale (strain ATCC 51463 / DSM 15997 / CCUG 23171 / CIP 104009 / LMG 9086) TaxID=867902 RepID=I4A0M8_ORNRL|nr:methionine-S-sulfoxide reductase [Ornithobacterium rhinotracheale DSM 15997]AIP98953.1 peptide methionine sulfoxide reductase [Ornithobacterium rhinotracheale ORT-UMN 88]KGB66891.1 peptide methionine sulfoxide reductase [Ornithobacterium rhinotracheale H06-030791]MBN3661930.1 peptide-methionine (S)-S-oxide reductase MsrA [Ornithobacterium rhinotracheale]